MTDKEKAIVMAYTGITMLTGDKLDIFYCYIQEKLGRPIYTHELTSEEIWAQIKEATKEDFKRLCRETSPEAIPIEWIVKYIKNKFCFADWYGGFIGGINMMLDDWEKENERI